jgi:hypothetical protein
MKLALKELEPFVKSGRLLQTGRPLKQFGGMLPREVLANWLLCATVNAVEGRQLTFSSDPIGGDGIIRGKATDDIFPTEHTMVSRFNAREGADAQKLILGAIEKKRAIGEPYASGKTLIVFLDAEAGSGLRTAWLGRCLTRSNLQPSGLLVCKRSKTANTSTSSQIWN